MVRVILSYGHGENTFKETGSKGVIVNGTRYAEHTFNAKVGEMTRKILEEHGIKPMVVQPPNGRDVSLSTRISQANKTDAELYYSIHANAGDKDAKGVCAFYHGYGSSANANKKKAEIYAKHAKAEGLDLYHGGVWGSTKNGWNDFRETREPKMFSVITENGFMTNKEDFECIFKNKDNFHEKMARVHAKTILEILGVKYKEPAKPASKPDSDKIQVEDTIYRVRKSAGDAKTQISAFKSLSSAKSLADRNPGYKVFDQDGKLIYTPSVIYTVKSGDSLSKIAEKYKTTVKKLQDANGIKDANKIYAGQKIKIK